MKKNGPQRVIDGRLLIGQNRAPLTDALLGLNILIFIAGLVSAGRPDPSTPHWIVLGLGLSGRPVWNGEIYRLVTHGFIHGGILHVLMNMLILYQLGPMLERSLGTVRFGLLYFVALLGGGFGAMLISPHAMTVGASGAICGIAGAILADERRQGRRITESSVFPMLALSLLIPVVAVGVSFGGHAGGLVFGYLTGYALLAMPARLRQRKGLSDAVVIAFGVIAIVGTLVAAATSLA